MLYEDELAGLNETARRRLDEVVHETVVVVRHNMFGDGYDVWWREDLEHFQTQNPYLVSHFAVEPATVETAWEYLELVDREFWASESEPLVTVWPRDAYVEIPPPSDEE